ncbi:rab3 GTPase-activating protein non-catalytic subunit-like isoform X1 [Argiope bruennichi]|uniref:rab3 GTPase-activating protein non-catalytic subunit-like isoform X1 n=2 Tax=Argiope bruennichi TaxID=94029 RepID=UPI002494622F|nr:rab3 GTPase-activating protein non-catalytic subunit-like isoform X1 [Argiope bruennichi]
MSCHLSKRAVLSNIRSLKSALKFGDESVTPDNYSVESWNNDWDFEDPFEGKGTEAIKLKGGEQSWMQECVASLSPMVDVLALGHLQQAVFFTSKWDAAEESEVKLKFVPLFEGKLSAEKDENITSILCLPLASQKRSLQGGPDWTCIIVGFSSGYIRIYTENAEQLLSQKFHDEPVEHLKCKTHVPNHFSNYSDQPDELVIVFSTVVVTVDGFGLFQTLRACRNQLARATAGRQEIVQPPPLTYKKWGFHEHDKLIDCEAAGVMTTTQFDHLVTESVRKGFYGAVKPAAPSNSLLMTTGCNPYVGYYHASEGSSQQFLAEVVHAVASKLMNFISSYSAGGIVGGLMGFNQPKVQKPVPKIEPATVLPLRFGLYDKRRQGTSIYLSPNKCLAAVTDAFGRVILFDVFKGTAVRMWKGYRDAQCGWVEVEDDVMKDKSDPAKKIRRVFFLVIYAPRRGILEVWCSQQGPRVAAFNVGKSGRLFCPGYTIVGGNFSTALMKDRLCSCYFLDVDGILKKIIVPFHLILSEKNSKRARDMHLLRELKMALKNTTKGKSFEIIKILRDMRISTTRIQALDNILNSRHSTPELVEEVVTALLNHLQKQDQLQMDNDAKLLQQYCARTLQLLKLYNTMNDINTKSVEALPETVEESVDIQSYSTSLCISEFEVGRILSLVTLHQEIVPVLRRQVRFSDDSTSELSFSDFVTCFVAYNSHQVKSEGEILKNLPIDLNSKISDKSIESLGGFLFHSSVHGGSYFSTLQAALRDSGILPEKLLMLLLKHWVSDAGFCPSPDKWINLQQVMKHISSLSDPKLVSSDSDHVSPWWAAVREALHKATGNVAAYIGAVVARSVSVIMAASFSVEHKKTNEEKKDKENEESGDSDWEAVSLDLEHWNLLVKQLEDVLMLNILLKSQPYGKAIVKDVNISIETLLNGGQGSVTDLIAVWAVSVGLEPEMLSSFLSETNLDNGSVLHKFLDDKSDSRSLNIVKGLLSDIRRKFPYSLNHDALLANCGWEHLMQWSKNKDTVAHLEQALSCLNLVQSSIIKNGFAAMMWKTFILKTFEATAHLMEKVGKTPKERLCRKELEMTDGHLENFLEFCCQILNIILESNVPAEVEDHPNFPVENFWHGHENTGHPPLIAMALNQKSCSNHQVYFHLMLANVLHLIVTFQMKNIKPLGLFSTMGRKAFFRELTFHIQESAEREEQGLSTSRNQFLLRATAAVVQSLPEIDPQCENSVDQADYPAASRKFSCILDLARAWELDLDEIRRHYVCELYSGGQDLLAQEVKSAVVDKALLSSQLLLLVGQRIHKIIFDSPNPAGRLGCLTPDVVSFLNKLGDMPLRCSNVPLSTTSILVDQILAYLPEESREHKLATGIRDSLPNLMQMVSKSS